MVDGPATCKFNNSPNDCNFDDLTSSPNLFAVKTIALLTR